MADSQALTELIEAWRGVANGREPYVLPGDMRLIKDPPYANKERERHRDTRFRFNLLPIPYGGDLRKARVYVLMLNPSLRTASSEVEGADEWENNLRNLKQENPGWLNDREKGYWEVKFRRLAAELQPSLGERMDAMLFLADNICILELVPYRSAFFIGFNRDMRRLEAVRLIRRFVEEDLLVRAEEGRALVAVVRGSRVWAQGWRTLDNVVIYPPQKAQSASFSPQLPGGAQIFQYLKRLCEEL